MTRNKLPPDTRLGHVHLTVSDLERSINYYRQSIGLRLIGRDAGEVSLGTDQRVLLRLSEAPEAVRVSRRTGLYHFALLLPSRQALGNALRNLIATQTKLSGGADHLVSEALYLDDPDGNGIEIYCDRPLEAWTIVDGRPQMDTLPLDFDGILDAADGNGDFWRTLPVDSVMGHIHLHVSHLEPAVNFYEEVIGFDLQAQLGGTAAFLSAGGYHHHLGVNTWAGVGAPPAPEGSVGLRYFVIALPDRGALNDLVRRLQRAQTIYELTEDGLNVRDPSNNRILFMQ